MRVQQLIDTLNKFPPQMEVYVMTFERSGEDKDAYERSEHIDTIHADFKDDNGSFVSIEVER